MVGSEAGSVVPPSEDIRGRPQGGFRALILLEGDDPHPIRRYPEFAVNAANYSRWPTTARHWLPDGLLAIAALGGTIALEAHGLGSGGNVSHKLDAIGVVLAAFTSLPLIAWRRAPLGVFLMTTTASAIIMLRGYPAGPPVGPTIALYLVAASRNAARPWTRQTTAIVAGMFCLHIAAFAIGHDKLPLFQVLVGGLVWALAWFAGERTRLRRQAIAELEQRAIDAERNAIQGRRLALAEERTRIARDLHDSAAHAINVIAVQAGAARLWHEQNPPRSLAALETIEGVARRTVAEIDQIVHSLREEERTRDNRLGAAGDRAEPPSERVEPPSDRVEPPPGLAALGSLLAQHDAADLAVTVTTVGVRRPVSSAVDRAAYRILQEALTNSARHGDGGAHVELAYGDDELELTVSNRVRDDAPERVNGGHGLVGMRERAALLGGDVQAGRDTGAFRVRARLPYGDAR
jgi:signal transduction histidine kinase